MLAEKEKQILTNAGYAANYNNMYMFKVKYLPVYKKHADFTAIFINQNTKEVIFEGVDTYKKILFEEAKSLIGGLKYGKN